MSHDMTICLISSGVSAVICNLIWLFALHMGFFE